MAGFYIVRVPGIVRLNFRDTYPHYVGPHTVPVYFFTLGSIFFSSFLLGVA